MTKKIAAGGPAVRAQGPILGSHGTSSREHPDVGDAVVAGRPRLPRAALDGLEDLFQAAGAGQRPTRRDLDRLKFDPSLSAAEQASVRRAVLARADEIVAAYKEGARGPARSEAKAAIHDFADHLDPLAGDENSDELDDLSARELAERIPRSGLPGVS